jgi:excisionase family DNA binding protein
VNSRRLAPPAGADDLFRLLANLLAPYLSRSGGEVGLAYYDQGNSPLGRRQHLDLVRRRLLPGHKVGRKVLVRRDAVDAYLETLKPGSCDRPTTPGGVLSDWGLKSGGHT